MALHSLPMITGGSPLLHLPNDLLDHIVSYLTRPDLLTLRLVSQAIHFRTSDRTFRTCYSIVRGAFWMPYSLYNLRAILRHKKLSTWVDCVGIHVDRLLLAEDDQVQHCDKGCSNDAVLREEYNAFVTDMQHQAGDGGAIAAYLDEIFTLYAEKCAQRSDIPSIHIVDQEHDLTIARQIDGVEDNAALPLRLLEKKYGKLVTYHDKLDCSAEIALILSRIDAAGLSPGYLQIGSNTFGVPIKMFRPPSVFNGDSRVFASINELHLNVQGTPPVEADAAMRDKDVEHAADFWRAVGARIRRLVWASQLNDLDSDKAGDALYSSDLVLERLHRDAATVFPNLLYLYFRLLIFSDSERLL
ncbi:uncharacterized protein LTR77_000676 [Saxophila tyrrhenica]|uniref:F-box domain-containing protein n=1 Tax=Saxophila tyrrhenica TaxID=1690608 RepID=A0AAV9PRK9_9PEZI|nr:hypothetical protein LTR77_000676 [Saxophila tyrrhenica]